jgi:NAD(P)H-flavin reductase
MTFKIKIKTFLSAKITCIQIYNEVKTFVAWAGGWFVIVEMVKCLKRRGYHISSKGGHKAADIK